MYKYNDVVSYVERGDCYFDVCKKKRIVTDYKTVDTDNLEVKEIK